MANDVLHQLIAKECQWDRSIVFGITVVLSPFLNAGVIFAVNHQSLGNLSPLSKD